MTWVKRAEPPEHRCEPPMGEVFVQLPAIPGSAGKSTRVKNIDIPAGDRGDLWRCDTCRTLWRVGLRCDACEHYGPGRHDGGCSPGRAWRPATLWQRWRHL